MKFGPGFETCALSCVNKKSSIQFPSSHQTKPLSTTENFRERDNFAGGTVGCTYTTAIVCGKGWELLVGEHNILQYMLRANSVIFRMENVYISPEEIKSSKLSPEQIKLLEKLCIICNIPLSPLKTTKGSLLLANPRKFKPAQFAT
jgi:hypothetical protein